MLVETFWALRVAGVSAVVVFWAFAVKTAWDALQRRRRDGETLPAGVWPQLILWPFGLGRASADAEIAGKANKMLVGAFAAILVVAGSAAVYSNLTFVPPAQTTQ